MKILIVLAICVASASAFISGPAPICNADNVEAGTIHMPHERYCQQFYTCNGRLISTAQNCPEGLLFSFSLGTSVCVEPTNPNRKCPNWSCESDNDIGNRFPDNCCNKFWECTSSFTYEEFNCPSGQVFDSVAEICVTGTSATCSDSLFCLDNILPNSNPACHDYPSASGDPCTYRTEYNNVVTENRPCPDGASFSPTECNCAVFDSSCNNGRITAAQAQANKAIDPQCRISRRVDFTFIPPATFSEKINLELRHYFRTSGVSAVNGEAVFQTGNADTFIYDYFFNDNELLAPFAMSMNFKFDTLPAIGTVVSLLSNEFSLDPNNNICSPATIAITARYEGISVAVGVWTFTITATGINGVTAVASGTLNGDTQDYFRIVLTFSGQIAATVQNRGPIATSPAISTNLNTVSLSSNQALGAKLRPNKCGFVIGRGLSGRFREFNIHEGCADFSRIL